jgi:hypothetical protein
MNACRPTCSRGCAPTLGDFDRLGDDFVVFFEPPRSTTGSSTSTRSSR